MTAAARTDARSGADIASAQGNLCRGHVARNDDLVRSTHVHRIARDHGEPEGMALLVHAFPTRARRARDDRDDPAGGRQRSPSGERGPLAPTGASSSTPRRRSATPSPGALPRSNASEPSPKRLRPAHTPRRLRHARTHRSLPAGRKRSARCGHGIICSPSTRSTSYADVGALFDGAATPRPTGSTHDAASARDLMSTTVRRLAPGVGLNRSDPNSNGGRWCSTRP